MAKPLPTADAARHKLERAGFDLARVEHSLRLLYGDGGNCTDLVRSRQAVRDAVAALTGLELELPDPDLAGAVRLHLLGLTEVASAPAASPSPAEPIAEALDKEIRKALGSRRDPRPTQHAGVSPEFIASDDGAQRALFAALESLNRLAGIAEAAIGHRLAQLPAGRDWYPSIDDFVLDAQMRGGMTDVEIAVFLLSLRLTPDLRERPNETWEEAVERVRASVRQKKSRRTRTLRDAGTSQSK